MGGGIGVTPMASLLASLVAVHRHGDARHKASAPRRVIFVWTTRDAAMFGLFGPLLEAAARSIARRTLPEHGALNLCCISQLCSLA